MAAEALKLTAQDLLKLGVIEGIISEPLGGAHRSPAATLATVAEALEAAMNDLAEIDGGVLKSRRRERFLKIGSEL